MIKKELCQSISEQTGIGQAEVVAVINTLIDITKKSISKNQPIFLRGLGTMTTVLRKPKKGQNIKEGTTVDIPAQYKFKFVPSKDIVKVCKKIPVVK